MRSAITLLFCVLALSSATQQLKINIKDILLVAEGVIEGIGLAEKWDDVAPCISSTEDAVQNIITAIQYFEKQDSIDVVRGLAALGKALKDLPTALKSCGAVIHDVDMLMHSLSAIASPTSFFFHAFKNLLVNGVDIYHEVYTAVEDAKAQNWEQFGVNVGKALAQIFLYGTVHTQNVAGPATDILLFLEGVVEGVSTDANFSDFATCLADANTIAQEVDQAINDFVAQTTESVIAGVKILGTALEALPAAIKDCESSFGELKDLIAAIEQLKDPRTLVYRISRSLILNGNEIWDEISATVADFKDGNYKDAGKNVGTILATLINPHQRKLGASFAKFVNQRVGFKVDANSKFSNWTIGEIKGMLGTHITNMNSIPGVDATHYATDLPQNFSAFDKWPECQNPILDQAHCGSCWAFSAAETLSDRFCVASGGKIKVQLSPQYLVSCSWINFGCSGGMLTTAWRSLEHSGLPTLDCEPYLSGAGDVPSCNSTCLDGSAMKSYYAKSFSTRWYMSTDSIKAEIMANGPVQTAFTVYEDFMQYKSGVYKHTTGGQLGGHAVKIVGWGNEDGQDYWLIANSWGTSWGLDGYFKIAFGDCGIDSTAVAGKADVESAQRDFSIFDF